MTVRSLQAASASAKSSAADRLEYGFIDFKSPEI